MQVSGVLSSRFTVLGGNDEPESKITSDKYKNTFMSSSTNKSQSREVFNNINEWKDFCHKMILADNIDFMA